MKCFRLTATHCECLVKRRSFWFKVLAVKHIQVLFKWESGIWYHSYVQTQFKKNRKESQELQRNDQVWSIYLYFYNAFQNIFDRWETYTQSTQKVNPIYNFFAATLYCNVTFKLEVLLERTFLVDPHTYLVYNTYLVYHGNLLKLFKR